MSPRVARAASDRGRVLVVDDDPTLRDTLALVLADRGLDVRTACDAHQARERCDGCDVVVTDVRMPGEDGLQLARTLVTRPDPPAVIVLTAFGGFDDAVAALRAGVTDFLSKPVPTPELIAAVNRALRLHGARPPASPEVPTLDGASLAMGRLRDRVARMGPLEGTVVIHGETGTGKERVARGLHAASRRADGPFVAVNCATLPEALAESELFGHVRGAFTGAVTDQPGLLRQADGGTLFLDEIGDLPAAVQPKLLRALEERSVRPVGGGREVPVDVRVIAASHRDLAADVEAGRFREDLWFRLAELELEVPPLRERTDDVPELAEAFLEQTVATEGLRVTAFSDEAMGCLCAWSWPGNVRELRHVVYQAAALADGPTIGLDDLPPRLLRPHAEIAAPTLDHVERAHIERVLASVGGNRTAAARILGVDRKTLYRKLLRP
ncbi:MAG: sigma-54-dependent Fis family transcriptional regulator [Alphaproteobacteria bacterium]|nr:sigma-54-dependent Fis family transcriptional regulator [Alphaproteobacteria bacterium]